MALVGGLALGGATVVSGCGQGRDSNDGDSGGAGERRGGSDEGRRGAAAGRGAEAVTRPLLREWADDVVWMTAPSEELPVAYVSMELMQVFVDHDYRDRVSWLLDAHISVSTALWRIPLPGDPEGQPITPGDAAREFEERSIREWDPSLRPFMDDVRIVRGRRTARRVDFTCVPSTAGAARWYAAGPWDVAVSDGSAGDTVREGFAVVGVGRRFSDRACTGASEPVRFVSWRAE